MLTGCQDTHWEKIESDYECEYMWTDSTGGGFVYDENDTTSFINQVGNYLWADMLSHANADGRQEVGCYIYRNQLTGEEVIGSLKYGPSISGNVGSQGSITPGPAQPNRNGITGDASVWVPVGFIHTHTTLYYEHDCMREVGPSDEDIAWAKEHNVTVFTVDFVGSKDGNKSYIYAGESDGWMVYTTGNSYYK